MLTIVLHGDLAKHGGPYRMQVHDVAEAMNGLVAQLPGLRADLLAERYDAVAGEDPAKGLLIPEDQLRRKLTHGTVHIVPSVEGEGRGIGKVILGIVEIVVGIYTYEFGGQYLIGLGISTAFAGISMMLAPSPQNIGGSNNTQGKSNFNFGGPANSDQQGGPVYLVYGRFRGGTVTISSAVVSETAYIAPATTDPGDVPPDDANYYHGYRPAGE